MLAIIRFLFVFSLGWIGAVWVYDVKLPVESVQDLIHNKVKDIKNSESVIYTMVNGRLFDAKTMNQLGNEAEERTNFYWENNKYNSAFEWFESTQSFTMPGCVCHKLQN